MTAFTNYMENKVVDHLFRTTTYTPSTSYIALFTAAPSDTGGGTEVTGGSYARVSVSKGDAYWNGTHGTTIGNSSGTTGTTSNASNISFPAPTANWGTVTHFGVFDALTGGNLLIWSALTTPKTVNNGDPAPMFQAGALQITVDN
jgi:hypothetical protein